MKTAKLYADKLFDARTSGTFCDVFEETIPLDLAYEIQAECTIASPEKQTIIGYKVGATSNESLSLLGLEKPFHGPLYQSVYAKNNGLNDVLSLSLPTQHNSRVEAEFVVSLKNDIKRNTNDLMVSDLTDSIDWVAPGFEFVASRFNKPLAGLGTLVIADFGGNQYMVVGEPFHDWQSLDLDNHPVELTIDDQEAIKGHSGLSIYGNPLEFVCWLLNQPAMHEDGLKAGQIVTCGTVTGAPFIHKGSMITADYGVLGKLAVKIE